MSARHVTVPDNVAALIAALLDPHRDSDFVEALDETWAQARKIFPVELAPKVDRFGFTEIDR